MSTDFTYQATDDTIKPAGKQSNTDFTNFDQATSDTIKATDDIYPVTDYQF